MNYRRSSAYSNDNNFPTGREYNDGAFVVNIIKIKTDLDLAASSYNDVVESPIK